MDLAGFIALYRSVTHDFATPPLWSDAEITEYANDAQNEACRRARLLVDSSSYTIGLSIGEPLYALDPKILFIRRVKLANLTSPTPKISYKDLDLHMRGWETATGAVVVYCTDMDAGQIRFVKIPTATDTAKLTVIRLPKKDMVEDGDKPEINERYHRGLLNWMLFRGFSKQDTETLDLPKAAEHEAKFIAEFGQPSTASDEAWIQNNHGYDEYEGLA